MRFMEESYDPSKYKLTWILVLTFCALHDCFIYIKHEATPMKYILDYYEISFAKVYVD